MGVNTDTMKAKGKTVTIHQVSPLSSLAEIKTLIRDRTYTDDKPAVGAGLYWLRKRGKDCIELKTDDDLQKAKAEHTVKNQVKDLRLAVACLPSVNKGKRKRVSTATGSDTDDEMAMFEVHSNTAAKKDNSRFNNAFVELVRGLERKGTKSSYSNKHLNLWVDHIVSGKSCGVEDPPNWEQYLEVIEFLPRDKKAATSFTTAQKRDASTSLSEMMFMHMTQQQEDRRDQRLRQEQLDKRQAQEQEDQRRRDDMWRTTMLAMMSPRAAPIPVPGPAPIPVPGPAPIPVPGPAPIPVPGPAPIPMPSLCTASTSTDTRPMLDMSVDDVSQYLKKHGFDEHVSTFELNGVDGSMLCHANHDLLEVLGVAGVLQRAKLLGLISKANRA